MKRRVLGFGSCCYHIVSRINEERYYLREREKAVFLELLMRAADFSGVRILTYCLMDNHFHLLVHVPTPTYISDRELLKRLGRLYTKEEFEALNNEFDGYQKDNNAEMLYSFRQRYIRRMHNLSEFMSTLKQRFSIWFNKSKNRCGPLWSSRFKSVLVQSSPDERGRRALSVVAAYIDLNALRAGLVDDANKYQWCGYHEAMHGSKRFIAGLRFAMLQGCKRPLSHRKLLQQYSALLQHEAGQSPGDTDPSDLPTEALLRCRISYFSTGWIFGDKGFVEFVTHRRPECFPVHRRALSRRLEEFVQDHFYTAGISAKDGVFSPVS